MLIYDAALKTPYRILGINLPKDSLLHLSNLGLVRRWNDWGGN